MSKKTPSSTKPPLIEMRAGKLLFKQKFGGKKLITGLVELIKNCRDWSGRRIWITVGNGFIEVMDDGVGMTAKNRSAFCSAAISSSNSEKQSGKFGTGTKIMLYLSKGVTVTTKTKEGPEVIQFELNTENYQTQIFQEANLQPTVLPASAWPKDIETGTKLRYDFSGQAAAHIKNHADIAKELAQELPYIVQNAILFNNEKLPAKEIKGKILRQELYDDVLGSVVFELYSLKGGSKNNSGILLSSTGMGEVRFAEFRGLLPVAVRATIPDVYSNLAELSGTITCRNFFGPYINDDRQSFQQTISDSDLLKAFIMLLRKKEIEVKSMLGLQDKTNDRGIKTLVGDLMSLSAKAYGAEFSTGEEIPVSVEPEPEQPKALRILGTRMEYEPGGIVKLTADINSDVSNAKPDELEWLYVNSGLRDVTISADKTQLTGVASDDFGHKTIGLVAGMHQTQTSYAIVPKLRLYLSANKDIELTVGQDYKLVIYNSELINGAAKWRVIGPGKIEVLGAGRKQGAAIFFATTAGEATILVEAIDVNGNRFEDTCVIKVKEPSVQLLKIKDYKFQIFQAELPGNAPVSIIKTGGDPLVVEHQLQINEDSQVWKQKDSKNSLALLVWIIGHEFARFLSQDIHEEGDASKEHLRQYDLITEGVMMDFLGV